MNPASIAVMPSNTANGLSSQPKPISQTTDAQRRLQEADFAPTVLSASESRGRPSTMPSLVEAGVERGAGSDTFAKPEAVKKIAAPATRAFALPMPDLGNTERIAD